ncbi:MAG: hypothetical protein SFV54_01195 [Bryobacteraceae bacterium]|nr:hypothetical protein [Bryobacteraceae bacterium]
MFRSLFTVAAAVLLIVSVVAGQCVNCAPQASSHDCCPKPQPVKNDHCGNQQPVEPCATHGHAQADYEKSEFDYARLSALEPVTAIETATVVLPEAPAGEVTPSVASPPDLFVLNASFLI